MIQECFLELCRYRQNKKLCINTNFLFDKNKVILIVWNINCNEVARRKK